MKVKHLAKCLLTVVFLSNLPYFSNANTSLKQIHVIFRHGERAPSKTYPNDPHRNYVWSGGWGELTNRGKFEIYSLGQKLRDLYPDFIPENYSHENVSVRSSYADRCLMSAQLLLAGLFPPTARQVWNKDLLWQPIPVNYLPRSQDHMIVMKSSCPKYDQEFSNILKTDAIKQIDRQNSDLYHYLTKCTGQKIATIAAVELLYDTLYIELLHNLTLPDWTKNVSLFHMEGLAARNLATYTETDFMKRMKGGVFVKHVIDAMSSEKQPLIQLYSAHDLSLVNILRTLDYHKGDDDFVIKPDFGASLILELHKNAQVKIFYRNGVKIKNSEEIIIDGCSDNCNVEELRASLKAVIPTNWDQECSL